MANPFVHVELATTDLDAARDFYGKLLGWKLTETQMDFGTYVMVDVGDGTGGGMMTQLMPNTPSAWLPYILVDDVVASTQEAKALGAEVYKEVTEVPNMGAFSIIADPTGATIGLWQSASA